MNVELIPNGGTRLSTLDLVTSTSLLPHIRSDTAKLALCHLAQCHLAVTKQENLVNKNVGTESLFDGRSLSIGLSQTTYPWLNIERASRA